MGYTQYRNDWDKLTNAEKQYLILHPWHADKIKENARKALKKAEDIFGKGSLHNGSGDAFRHCYWSALLARDIGSDSAKKFTSAHESRPGNPKPEKEMDSHNNNIGIEIARKNLRASDEALARLCQNALFSGRLKVMKQSKK